MQLKPCSPERLALSMIDFSRLKTPTLGVLKPGEVHLWQFALTDFAELTPNLLPLLTTTDQASYHRAKQHQQHPPHIASRGFLKHLLAHYVSITPEKIEIVMNTHGKPQLAHVHTLQFSISHTATHIVFALTQHSLLGVDLENQRDLNDYLDLAKRFFSVYEFDYLNQLPKAQIPQAFIRLWTLKEAFVKAVGFGLSYPLSDFSIDTGSGNPYILEKQQTKEPTKADEWSCFSWEVPSQHYLALVIQGKPQTLYYQQTRPGLILGKSDR